jgi:glutamate-1-semialdehyde 2,1-aminomutase
MRYPESSKLAERARQIIPGGHHLSGRPLIDTETTPMYFQSASGSHIRDVDGHDYVDWLMAFGPYLLGYARREVDEAGNRQAQHGRLLSLNHPLHVAFIEALLPLFPGAEMGAFFRTGSEATTASLRVARQATGRRKVARCGYHGWHDWCLPLADYVPAGLDTQVLEFSANDPQTLQTIFDAHPQQIAAVILAPEMMLPLDGDRLHLYAQLTRRAGAVFIMDEVKTGFRSPGRSISARFGVTPDIITLSKAMGNGWPVAALLGKREVLACAEGMHFSATFHGDVSAMAAALQTIALIEAEQAADHAERIGGALIEGLRTLGNQHTVPVVAYPEPIAAMPFMRFDFTEAAHNVLANQVFYRAVLARGVLLHPRHLWFPSAAHTPIELEQTLEAASAGMLEVARALSLR